MVNDCARPVAPQLTIPFGSRGSVPKAISASDTATLPCVPVPTSWMGVGSAVHSASRVLIMMFAGYATAEVGSNVTLSVADTEPAPRLPTLAGESAYPLAFDPATRSARFAAADPGFALFETVNVRGSVVSPIGNCPNRKLDCENDS